MYSYCTLYRKSRQKCMDNIMCKWKLCSSPAKGYGASALRNINNCETNIYTYTKTKATQQPKRKDNVF